MFEDTTDRDKDQLAEVRAIDRLNRRRENRVVSCLFCGDTLGIYIEGEVVPDMIHVCTLHDALAAEVESQMDRLREK